jgi:hypothetical protein
VRDARDRTIKAAYALIDARRECLRLSREIKAKPCLSEGTRCWEDHRPGRLPCNNCAATKPLVEQRSKARKAQRLAVARVIRAVEALDRSVWGRRFGGELQRAGQIDTGTTTVVMPLTERQIETLKRRNQGDNPW